MFLKKRVGQIAVSKHGLYIVTKELKNYCLVFNITNSEFSIHLNNSPSKQKKYRKIRIIKKGKERDAVTAIIKQNVRVSLMFSAIYCLPHYINVKFPPGITCFQKVITVLMSGSGK